MYRSQSHNTAISEGLKASRIKGYDLIITDPETGDEIRVSSCQEASEIIGCSRQLVSQVLNPRTYNRSAKGWTIELVEMEEDDDPFMSW